MQEVYEIGQKRDNPKQCFKKEIQNVEEAGLIDGHDHVGNLQNSTNTYT